jgi:hypothetical protein
MAHPNTFIHSFIIEHKYIYITMRFTEIKKVSLICLLRHLLKSIHVYTILSRNAVSESMIT